MVQVILKKVGIWSLAKFQAIAMGVIGLVTGGVLAGMMVAAGKMTSSMISNSVTGGVSYASFINPYQIQSAFSTAALYTLIITPIVFAIMGLISGFVTALLYNLVAKISKGIKMDFDEIEEKQ